jgi:hypothetical protein
LSFGGTTKQKVPTKAKSERGCFCLAVWLFVFGVLRSCRFGATLVVLTRHELRRKKKVLKKKMFF